MNPSSSIQTRILIVVVVEIGSKLVSDFLVVNMAPEFVVLGIAIRSSIRWSSMTLTLTSNANANSNLDADADAIVIVFVIVIVFFLVCWRRLQMPVIPWLMNCHSSEPSIHPSSHPSIQITKVGAHPQWERPNNSIGVANKSHRMTLKLLLIVKRRLSHAFEYFL